MGLLPFPTDTAGLLVLDASVVINLNASGFAKEIIGALTTRPVIVSTVLNELEAGNSRGRQGGNFLRNLLAEGVCQQVELDESGADIFARLVAGRAVDTLDDGEAATIAYAIQRGAVALIDERKATRICAEKFPALHVACTTDLLMYPPVALALGDENLKQGVLNALKLARMRIIEAHAPWVIDLIGIEHARSCFSLPERVRQAREV
jgi:predicted nucleic acid-binding protein